MKHFRWFAPSVLVCALFLFGCDNDDTYTVKYSKNGATVGEVPEDSNEYKDGEIVTVQAPKSELKKNGYRFYGWTMQGATDDKIYQEGDSVLIDLANIVFDAAWEEDETVVVKAVKYKVEHYVQNLEDDDYSLKSSESKSGEVGELTKAEAKSYDGFEMRSFVQETISSEESAVVIKIYYDRKYYTVTYDKNAEDAVGDIPASQTKKYETEIAVAFAGENTVLTRNGYTFAGWAETADATAATYSSGGTTTLTLGASDVTLYAVWIKIDG